ncbi:MAG: type II secretion system F family protein [Planctomycetota bacterium]|nr:MAG: type II secretion system F family protein [Planctomycetota bacterium]
MGTYAYIARDASGARQEGTLAAASEQAALAALHNRDLAPVRVDVVREVPRLRRAVSTRHLATAYTQLADLLRVGMPVLKALELLGRNKSNPRLAAVITEIAEEVSEGARIADTMAARPDIFPAIQVAMIRAGETGGFLEQVFARLGEFLENQAEMRARVVGNMIYPVMLLCVGLAIVVAALVFFVPKFQTFYARIELPLPTKILMASSTLLTRYWLALLVGGVVAVFTGSWALRRPGVRQAFARWQLRLPKIGPLIASIAIARFTRILGTLLDNGVPMIQAMQISRDAIGHPLLAIAIDDAVDAVRSGEPLAVPLSNCGMFPEDVAEMIAVGESANNLPVVLTAIAETVEKRVDRMLQLFVRLMEPLMLLALAGVVLFIFIALIVPMVKLSSTIG